MGVVRYLAVGGLVAASLTTIAASPPVAAAPGDVALDTAFADDGVLTAPEVLDEYGGFTTDDSGRVIVAGTVADGPGEQLGHIAVARLRPDGSPDPEFGDDGVVITSVVTVMGRFAVASVDVLDDGSVIAAGIRQFDPEEVFSRALWTVKLDTAGTPVPGYGADGVAIEEQPYTAGDPIGGFASDGSAVFSQSGFGTTFLTRVNAAGQFFDLMPGETVIAVGNAFGYENTVTVGIISALHRDVQVSDTQSYDVLGRGASSKVTFTADTFPSKASGHSGLRMSAALRSDSSCSTNGPLVITSGSAHHSSERLACSRGMGR